MRIVVTGANGFVGAAVVRQLARAGLDVFGVVRSGGGAGRVSSAIPPDRILRMDLHDSGELARQLASVRPDCCIHLAWYMKHGECLSARENLRCVTMSLDLFARLADAGCRRIVGVGTCFEYDTSLGYLSEGSAHRPTTLYGASKLAVYHVLEQFATLSSISWAWARLFYMFGTGEQPERLVPHVVRTIRRRQRLSLRGPDNIRDYLHVDDVASALVAVASHDLSGAVNIGSGEPLSVRHIVNTIARLLRRDIVLEDVPPTSQTDPPFICANVERLKNATRWRPKLSLEQGLARAIAEQPSS